MGLKLIIQHFYLEPKIYTQQLKHFLLLVSFLEMSSKNSEKDEEFDFVIHLPIYHPSSRQPTRGFESFCKPFKFHFSPNSPPTFNYSKCSHINPINHTQAHNFETLKQKKSRRKMVGPTRPQFVLFGSSVVQMSYNVGGWGAILTDLYARKADVILRGYSGWNSRLALQVLDRVFPKDAAVQPTLVIVYFGGNDATNPHPSGKGAHVPLPEYVENMRKIALHLKSLSENIRIIFLSSPPVNEDRVREIFGNALDDQARTNEGCLKYTEALVELGQQLDIKVIDLYTAIRQRDDWAKACFIDGIHFSSEGSKIVVKEILKVLKDAEWEPSLYWLSMPAEFPEDSPYYVVGPDGETTLNVTDHVCTWQKEWVNI